MIKERENVALLSQHNPSDDEHGDCVVAGIVADSQASCGTLTAGCGGAIGEGTVENKRFGAIDIGNGDKGLVERGVAAITDKVIKVLLIVIFIAATHAVLLAQAYDGQGLVATLCPVAALCLAGPE